MELLQHLAAQPIRCGKSRSTPPTGKFASFRTYFDVLDLMTSWDSLGRKGGALMIDAG
jgi:hypothetical protein